MRRSGGGNERGETDERRRSRGRPRSGRNGGVAGSCIDPADVVRLIGDVVNPRCSDTSPMTTEASDRRSPMPRADLAANMDRNVVPLFDKASERRTVRDRRGVLLRTRAPIGLPPHRCSVPLHGKDKDRPPELHEEADVRRWRAGRRHSVLPEAFFLVEADRDLNSSMSSWSECPGLLGEMLIEVESRSAIVFSLRRVA